MIVLLQASCAIRDALSEGEYTCRPTHLEGTAIRQPDIRYPAEVVRRSH
jgi:hypothetical protein